MSESLSKNHKELSGDHSLEVSLQQLTERYGDRAVDYLDAAVVRKELTYDDYIETRSLLSLQTTLTEYHDELIFKIYHQQTELWFRLTLHEIERAIRSLIAESPSLADAHDASIRINRYFGILTDSFSVLLDGLSSEEFLIFRRAFGSSSGFQSSQFRAIEILCGLERNATAPPPSAESRPVAERTGVQIDGEQQATFYWERAARHLTTDEPTLTLLKFKEEHLAELNALYESRKPFSLRMGLERIVRKRMDSKKAAVEMYEELLSGQSETDLNQIAEEFLKLDDAVVLWKQMHLRVAAKHLKNAPRGTGETNWAEYLAKSIAEQRCFPELRLAKKKLESSASV